MTPKCALWAAMCKARCLKPERHRFVASAAREESLEARLRGPLLGGELLMLRVAE